MDTHGICEEYEDIAPADLIEVWIDETERCPCFLFERGCRGDSTGHWNTARWTAVPITKSGGRGMSLLSESKDWTEGRALIGTGSPFEPRTPTYVWIWGLIVPILGKPVVAYSCNR